MSEGTVTSYTTTVFSNPFNSFVNATIMVQAAGDLDVQLYSIEGALLREVLQYVNSEEDGCFITFNKYSVKHFNK